MLSNQTSTREPFPLIKLSQRVLRLAVIAPFVYLLMLISFLGQDVPFWDQWDFIPFLEQAIGEKNLTFELLWNQHAEHRIFFPKLIMYGLLRLTNWDIRYELFTNLLLGSLIFGVLRRAAHRSFSGSRHLLFLDAALSIVVFSVAQCENWLWGWQIQIFLNTLAVSLGFYYLTSLQRASLLRLGLAILCGIVATGSFGNGILFWPIGFILLGISSGPQHNLYRVLWLLVSLLIIVFYFRDYHFIEGRSPFSYLAAHPLDGFLYLLAYLGCPIAQFQEFVWLACSVGFVGISLFVFLVIQLYRHKLLLRNELLFWHALLFFALASDGLTAMGRVEFGIDQAIASRYVTIGNLFWIWLLAMGYYLIANRYLRFSRGLEWVMILLTGLFVASTAKDTYTSIRRSRHLAHVEVELKKPHPDVELVTSVYPNRDRLPAYYDFLKKHRLSVFRHTP